MVCGFLTLYLGSKLSSDCSYYFVLVTSILFDIVSVSLLVQLVKLFRVARLEFEGEFSRELNQIKWYLMAFFGTFLIRSVALWAVQFDRWPVFQKTYENNGFRVANSTVFVVEFFFYNILPIGYLCFIHFHNFRQHNPNL